MNVCLHGELKARGSDASAQFDDVHRHELREKVIERRETQAEVPVTNQSNKRAVPQRQCGQAATDVLVRLVREAGVEVGRVQARVETGPTEVIGRQRRKQPRWWQRRVRA